MEQLDKQVEQVVNIPIEIANNNCIKSYKVLDGDKVVKYYERAPHPQDQPVIIEHGDIITKPMYFGEWLDKTDEYQVKLEQLAKDKKSNIVSRSGRVRTREEIREEELKKAQSLLAELLLNNETPTEKASILEKEATND